MIGTILNVAGIIIGGVIGLAGRNPLPPSWEGYLKVALGAFITYFGLRLMWLSVGGTFLQILVQFLVLLVALTLGRLVGRLLGLQEFSNRIGRQAREQLATAQPGARYPAAVGFTLCATLFCATPLGMIGAIVDGVTLSAYFYPLAAKGVIEGLATMGFVRIFGWGAILAALPVLAFQGTITLVGSHLAEPMLAPAGLLDSLNLVCGLLIVCVALVLLEIKKIKVADYLPSLVFAPLLTWAFRAI